MTQQDVRELTYQQLRSRVYHIKEEYGRRARTFSIGRSVLGRGLYAVGVGEVRGSTLFVGGVGAREWTSSLMLLSFYERLMKGMKDGAPLAGIEVRKAMEGRSLTILPALNPDGIELALLGGQGAMQMREATDRISGGDYAGWQANARGVDLRLNFEAGWEAKGAPAPEGYPGPRAMSEPETRAVANFCTAFDIRQVYVFGSGKGKISYRTADSMPARSRLIAQVLAGAAGIGVEERTGPGSLKDWFVQKTARPGFLVTAPESEELLSDRMLELMVLSLMI